MTRRHSSEEIEAAFHAAEAATLRKGWREARQGTAMLCFVGLFGIVASPAFADAPPRPDTMAFILLGVIVAVIAIGVGWEIYRWRRSTNPCPHQDIDGDAEAQSIRRTEFGR